MGLVFAPSAAASISISSSSPNNVMKFKGSTTITVRSEQGRYVELQALPFPYKGQWKKVRWGATGSQGRFVTSVSPSRNTKLRAVAADVGGGRETSRAIKILVNPIVRNYSKVNGLTLHAKTTVYFDRGLTPSTRTTTFWYLRLSERAPFRLIDTNRPYSPRRGVWVYEYFFTLPSRNSWWEWRPCGNTAGGREDGAGEYAWIHCHRRPFFP